MEWTTQINGTCCTDIAHAGGLLDGVPYTNSLEALDAARAAGRTLIEVDLLQTADGRIVLAHDWDAYEGQAPTFDVYQADTKFTVLDWDGMLGWLDRCRECRIVTDPKMSFADFWPVFERSVSDARGKAQFILQVYDTNEAAFLDQARPGQPMILTTYRMDGVDADALATVRGITGLAAITMPIDRVPWAARAVAQEVGRPVFTHGYPWMMQSTLLLKIARAFGAHGFYRD
ncbi:MAG: glycerophosphodiester phosphodiesterase family protein [Pseudomonadota bacterium]